MMDAIEKRARELLAAEYVKQGLNNHADMIGNSRIPNPADALAIRAIIVALTPPDGYVLAPVVPTEEMEFIVGNPHEARFYWEAMIAARPGVPNGK